MKMHSVLKTYDFTISDSKQNVSLTLQLRADNIQEATTLVGKIISAMILTGSQSYLVAPSNNTMSCSLKEHDINDVLKPSATTGVQSSFQVQDPYASKIDPDVQTFRTNNFARLQEELTNFSARLAKIWQDNFKTIQKS